MPTYSESSHRPILLSLCYCRVKERAKAATCMAEKARVATITAATITVEKAKYVETVVWFTVVWSAWSNSTESKTQF